LDFLSVLKVFPQELHHLFFPFGDFQIRILAQPMKEDDRIENFSTHDTMPPKKDIIDVIELLENHATTASLASHFMFFLFQHILCCRHIPFLLAVIFFP